MDDLKPLGNSPRCDPTPDVSFVVLAYMQEQFIDESVRSALGQDFLSIEFIFSDDCSSDNTFRALQDAVTTYAKKTQVVTVLKTERNLGLAAHLAFAMRHAHGRIIVFQAGDDVSMPDRTKALIEAFRANPEVMMVMSNVRVVDETGRTLRPRYAPAGTAYPREVIDLLRQDFPYLIGASEAIRREVFELFGPMKSPECYEDRAFAFRSALLGQVKFIDRNLLDWRHHGTNMSNFVDFKSPEALKRLRAHFLKQLRRTLIYLRQHLIDLEYLPARQDSEKRMQIQSILRKRLACKRLEYAVRAAMPWKLVCLRAKHSLRHGASVGWLIRQFAIRIGHRVYFRLLGYKVRASIKAYARASNAQSYQDTIKS